MARIVSLALVTAALVGCSTPPTIAIEILSPEPGEEFIVGSEVLLDFAATADGVPIDIPGVWTGTDWSVEAAAGEVASDLPLGAHALELGLTYEEGVGFATVDITIVEPPPDPVAYDGNMDVNSDITSPFYNGTVPCEDLGMSFVLQPEGDFLGQGSCDPGMIDPMTFTITGQVSGNAVSGTMTLPDNPNDLPFEGSKGEDGYIAVSFDETYQNGEGTMRLYGTWNASPGQ